MLKQNQKPIYESLARIFLPAGILDLFEVVGVEENHTGQIDATGTEVCIIHIYLDERDLRDDTWHDLKPNGFTESRSVNDFPVRDRKVVLHIRRRRWLDSNGSNTIINYDGIVAECTSYSKEFADALKKIFGYIPDSGPFSGAVL